MRRLTPTGELIAVYSSSPNVNLLDDTSFTNDDAMEAWLRSDGRISKVQNDPTADPYDEENYDDELFDNFFGITTGTQSRNAYMGRFKGTAAQSSLAYLLQQVVHKTGQTEKLEGGRWYTFSFWVKGNSQVHTSINFVDETSGQKMYVDGVQRDANHYWQWKNLTNTWTRHTLTFKAIDTLVENASYYVQWLMTDTTSEQYVYVCMTGIRQVPEGMRCGNGEHQGSAPFPALEGWRDGLCRRSRRAFHRLEALRRYLVPVPQGALHG